MARLDNGTKVRMPDLYFCEDGRIDIVKHISRKLSLKSKDRIGITTIGGEYYLYKSNDVCSYDCTPLKRDNDTVYMYCKRITDFIASVTGDAENHLMAGEFVDVPGIGRAVTIITRRNLKTFGKK